MFTWLRTFLIEKFLTQPESFLTKFSTHIRLIILKNQTLCWLYHRYFSNYPDQIQIELTNMCNLRCVMCPNKTMKRKKGLMNEQLYRKIIDEIGGIKTKIPVFYTGFGEPLLDKNIIDKIHYAKKAGITTLGLVTNGAVNISRELARELVVSGLKYIFIDVDADTPTTYSQIRSGGNFENMVSNIELLIEENSKNGFPVWIILGYLLQEKNKHEFDLFTKRWKNIKNVSTYMKVTHSWAGEIPRILDAGVNIKTRYPCHAVWGSYFITLDGKIPLCCHDYEAEQTMGDAGKQNIFTIWNTVHRQARENMIKGDFSKIPLCQHCVDWKMYEETLYLKSKLLKKNALNLNGYEA